MTLKVMRATPVLAWTTALQFTPKYSDNGYHVLSTIPEPRKSGEAPDGTQQNISSFYAQAVRALDRGDWDAAGMSFRKSLDITTKHLIRDINPSDLEAVLKRNLHQRIEWLHSQAKLTKELKDLGHFIRDEGNGAAHEETPYAEPEARQLHKYAEVFLVYVFTIPQMLSRVPTT